MEIVICSVIEEGGLHQGIAHIDSEVPGPIGSSWRAEMTAAQFPLTNLRYLTSSSWQGYLVSSVLVSILHTESGLDNIWIFLTHSGRNIYLSPLIWWFLNCYLFINMAGGLLSSVQGTCPVSPALHMWCVDWVEYSEQLVLYILFGPALRTEKLRAKS